MISGRQGQQWYVVHSQPNSELKAITHLNRQGFITYLPRYLKRHRHARRIEHIAAPLFPRYLFVAIDMGVQRWRSIFSTVGVSRLVCSGDMPQAVPDQIVAALRAREDERGFFRLDLRPSFRAGDKICILDGALAGCFGLYEGLKDSERVAVLLNLLGRKVRVTVEVERVAAV